ncbi:MAG: S1C family serine protease, partial [Atribacterota bacterium]
VEGAKNGYARIVGQKINYNIDGYTAIDLNHDLIILRVPGIISSNLPLGNSDSVQVGETVYVAGNPQGLEGTFSHGIVSGIRLVGNDKLLQITAPISPGSSGGPVLNNRGEVIGISFASFSDGQNLNFAIPSNYLKPLINKSQQVIPLAQIKLDKSKKSIVSEIGKQSSEGVVAGQIAWKYSHAQNGSYSFSLQNKLRENVKNIYCFVIFYDSSGNPIDVDPVQYRDIIPAGLAKRVTIRVHESVQKLTTKFGSIEPHTKVEIRVLHFDIIK